MPPIVAVIGAFVLYFLGYRLYGRYLSKFVFKLSDSVQTPAHRYRDDIDYVPTRRIVLFGHHYASITGLAPMLGPAVAVIWGWLPAMLWVVLGAVLIGAVHDFAALVISLRARGLSVGKIAEGVIGSRTRTLFLLIIFFAVSLAMGVFVFVIAKLFSVFLKPGIHPELVTPSLEAISHIAGISIPTAVYGYPQAVLPSGLLMLIALISGWLLYKKGLPLLPVALVGFALELVGIWLGMKFPTMGIPPSLWPSSSAWTWILLGYAFLASVLPVWSLLQSRDFLNSLLLYLGLGLAYIGFFAKAPQFAAPAVVLNPPGAPSLFPFVFIVIACGSVSGFHGLVSSGTTAKQLDRETDALPIGYGGMLGESLLGLLATLACTAGFASPELWQKHYGSWQAAQGLATKIDAFIQGTASFLSALKLSSELSEALIAMVVVSFALTTLDSATRLLRFNIEEMASSAGIKFVRNRYISSALAVAAIAFFAFYEVNGKPAALALWSLFGTTNQLLAGLTLILVSLYLKKRRWPVWPTAVPAFFMMATTLSAMLGNLRRFWHRDTVLFAVGTVLFLLAVWLVVEAFLALRRRESTDRIEVTIE